MNSDSSTENPDAPLTLSPLTDEAYSRYLEALLAGDSAVCRATVDDVLERERPLVELYEGVFRRSLYEVGELWERGCISVADEHLATAMAESLLTRVYPVLFNAPHNGHSAVVSCVANELHQIGGKMVADTFEMHGWDCYFLGANTPRNELLDLIEKKQPDVVALSVTVYSSMATLIEIVAALRNRFATMEIWVGGQAFNWGGEQLLAAYSGVFLHRTLSEFESHLINWKDK